MSTKRSAKELILRYLVFIVGLFFLALGIAFTKTGALGVSPISSVAHILSLRFSFLSMGNWLILWNCLLILAQILILRRRFQPIQLLQFPVSFLLGWFTDLGMWLISFLPLEGYPAQLGLVLIGVVVLGFGIALTVLADVVMNAGEAFVKVVADAIHKKFGHVKVVFDVSCVTCSILLSLLLFNGSVEGTREGTLIAAFCTGFIVQFFIKLLKK